MSATCFFSGSGIVGQSNGQLRFHVHAERAFSGKVAEVLQVREVRVEARQHVRLNVLFEPGDGLPYLQLLMRDS